MNVDKKQYLCKTVSAGEAPALAREKKMGNYDVRTLQLRLLDILADFDRVCRENDLRYYMTYGTMLGAVRHKGFIPWDDDIDLGMPRPDYERLIAHWREWLPEHLEFVCSENDSLYPVAFGKIQDARTTLIERRHYYYLGGIYLDIMPIDGIADNPVRQFLHKHHYHFYFRALYLTHCDPYRHGHGPSSWFPLLCRKVFTMQGIQAKIRRILLKYPFEDSKQICLYNDHTKAIIAKEVFGEPALYQFEGRQFYGPAKAHEYLLACFGDTYMQLPPENKRHVHAFYYLDFEHSYKDDG